MLMITSFNEILLEQYGKRMINEFSEMSDGTIKLVVVYEGDNIPNISLKNVKFIPFTHSGHHSFIKKFGHLHEANGFKLEFLPDNKINVFRDFRFDAVRFSFKIFSLLQVLELFHPLNHFGWIDADVRCLQKFSSKDLLKFFPDDDELMSYLGRINFPSSGAYSECGFLGFNGKHPSTIGFLNRFAEIYQNGEIFSHEQWHDSWIWDQTRIEFEGHGVKFKNISGSASSTEHPFINTDLGIYFDHLKGPERKRIGKSFIQDYKVGTRS
jgi:hypothetical protein